MKAWGTTVAAVERALTKHDRLTAAELSEETAVPGSCLRSVVCRMRKATPLEPQRVYIAGWTFQPVNGVAYLRAQYALGSKPDAPRPKPKSRRQIERDRYQRAKRLRLNSPFNIGAIAL